MIKIKEARVNFQKNISAITELPQFSWILESNKKNIYQKAYQLLIAEDYKMNKIVFDSGKIISEQSTNIKTIFSMKSASKYFFKVKVWTEDEESEFSSINTFLTGLIKNNEWKGKFITGEDISKKNFSNGWYLRKEFTVSKKIKEAYSFTTALGLYKLFLNGEKVGDEELSPGWTSYNNHLLYQVHDITDKIKMGSNAVGVHIGAGWYKGEMGFVHARNYYGKQTAFSGQILIRYADGTEDIIISDTSWKKNISPVVFSEIYAGEIYDASLEQEGWNKSNFNDHLWKKCKTIFFDKKVLTVQNASLVKKMEKLPVKNIFTTPKGEICIDFGQNMAGWVEIKAEGKQGDKIEIRCFETLDADGNVYFENLRKAQQKIIYKFGKKKKIEYHPNFTYQGFRYAQIISFPKKPAADNFTAYALYSDMELTGTFLSAHKDLNQLHKNIHWSLKSNFVDIPTDCPQRDERLGWTGDAQIFAMTACYLRNVYTFYSKWLEDLKYEQTDEGEIPHVVPDIITGYCDNDWLLSQGTHSASGWADAAVFIPWTLYLMYGDTKVIKKQYDSMKTWINFMKKNSVDNIWNYKLQFGDWIALDSEEGSFYGATPNDFTCTAYYIRSVYLFSKMSRIIERKKESIEYFNLYKNILNSFRKKFFDIEGNLKIQTQTAHILALCFNLAPIKYRKKIAAALVELLKKQTGHLVTGFLGTPYFCYALSENGYVKEAYELLLKDDFPSWLYQVKMGATTMWEHWDGIKPDGTMWDPKMNSFNHYAYGAIDEWIFRTIGGINFSEKEPGFKRIIIYPKIEKKIGTAEVTYYSPYGQIKVKWEIKDNNIVNEEIKIPVNTTALIKLFNGEKILKADNLIFKMKNKVFEAETGSGTYHICYELKNY